MSDPKSMEKLIKLEGILREMENVLVAYSGGVDSTFLLKVAVDILGDKVLAVTAVSPTYTQSEHKQACALAESIGVRHVTISTNELEDANFCENPPERCYYCKSELFGKLREIADKEKIAFIADASNLDDCLDFRPGRKAGEENNVRSPLLEAKISKEEVRLLSRNMGLETWDHPSAACLASRFPYGERITQDKLTRAEKAEDSLRELGFKQLRVRSHGDIARIEVDADSIQKITEPETRAAITKKFKDLGFTYVTADLTGYRTGSMNEPLSKEQTDTSGFN